MHDYNLIAMRKAGVQIRRRGVKISQRTNGMPSRRSARTTFLASSAAPESTI
jgi:acid phosphatase family membrane protein YuiD